MRNNRAVINNFNALKSKNDNYIFTLENIDFYFDVLCSQFKKAEEALIQLMNEEEARKYKTDRFFREFVINKISK